MKEVGYIKQIGNLGVVEWPDKAKISDQLPQTFLRGVPLGCLRMTRITSRAAPAALGANPAEGRGPREARLTAPHWKPTLIGAYGGRGDGPRSINLRAPTGPPRRRLEISLGFNRGSRGVAHSRTCDRGPGITRERVKGRSGTKTCPTDFPCPVTDTQQTVGHRLFFWGRYSCRVHFIEQNVAATWLRSVAASRHFAPQPKCEGIIRCCLSITGRWLRLRSWAH